MDETILKVEHLCQYFKSGKTLTKAVDDISFEIKKGEVFGLVGESGCGKTTTGRSIIKLYDISNGNVIFRGQRICAGTKCYRDEIKKAELAYKKIKGENPNDRDILERAKAERDEKIKALMAEIKSAERDQKRRDREFISGIQMIFQDPLSSLNPRQKIKDIIAEGLIIRGVKNKKQILKEVYEILEKVGLSAEHANRYPFEFSGGQRQRIGIARAIIMHPDLIIADEPISALDVSIQAQIINLLNDLKSDSSLSILFIAHDLSVVKYFSDRIAVMYLGKIVELATSTELFERPIHPYTRSLLSSIPIPDPRQEKARQRIVYDPKLEHDYALDKPTFREIFSGHFVYCNKAEAERYTRIYGIIKE
jgi:oligopeptide transport system ATP-binding protein